MPEPMADPHGKAQPDDHVAPPTTFARVQGGEPLLAQLIAENLDRLRAFVRAHMGPDLRSQESDLDLLQSVCGDVLAQRSRFDFQGEAQFRAYLFTAARNKLLERHRHRHAARRDPLREQPADTSLQQQLADHRQPAPSAAARAAERSERIARALQALSPEHREVVTLTQFAGLSPSELAEHFGRTPDAVRMLLGRALARLHQELARQGLGPTELTWT